MFSSLQKIGYQNNPENRINGISINKLYSYRSFHWRKRHNTKVFQNFRKDQILNKLYLYDILVIAIQNSIKIFKNHLYQNDS